MSGGSVEEHEVLDSEPVFEGRVFKAFLDTVRLPDGREAVWERVAHPGAVGIVPLMPDGTLLMVRQYRHPVRGVLLEIPAGKLDRGEPPMECAKRELVEETGYRAGEMIKLAEFYNSPGYSDEYFHLYVARDLEEDVAAPEEDEFIELERLTVGGALEMIESGDITDAKSIIGIALASLFLEGEFVPEAEQG